MGWTVFARRLLASLIVLVLLTSAFAYVSFGTRADQTSGDQFGYYWTDSNAPTPSVAFDWVDITSTGTDVGFYDADNSYVGPVPIGFDFEFYGNNYSMINISCNGYIQFGTSSSNSYNYIIPYEYDNNNIVAAFWDDLVVYDTSYNYGAVYYETIGVSPNSQMVIEYYEVSRDYYYNLMTFEIILNETGEIWLQYLTMNGETGSSATVGMEDIDGTIASQYSYNQPVISDGLAIVFERGLVGFGPDAAATANWGDVAEYELTLMNGQDVTDSFDITLNHSELGWTVEILDGSYTPLADNNLNGDPDTGDLAPGETFEMIVLVTVPDPPSGQDETTILLASSYLDPAVNDTATLVTRADQAVFSPPFSDYGWDTDLDGDYDYLVVDVVVDAVVSGYLSLEGALYDSGAELLTYDTVYVSAPAGQSTISLYFVGEEIYEDMEDGPYSVTLWLYDADWNSIGSTTYDTSAYSYTDFDEPIGMFLPPHSDYAVDDGDSNSLYDTLIVNASIEVFEPGDYTVEADVYDFDTSDYICYVEASESLDVGVHELQLQIPAWAVNESGLDGACYLYMALYRNGYWLIDDEYETGAYLWSDFEGRPVTFAPPYDDFALDSDLDGYYNHVIITIPIECVETGVYDIDIVIYEWIYEFDTVHDTLSLEEGTTTDYTVVIGAEAVRNAAVSDNLDLDMVLTDNATHVEYDTDSYTTSYYYYWNFDEVGATFDYFDDYGRDTDSDGYFNEVVVLAYIDPLSTGYYMLEMIVYDYYYDTLDNIQEVIYMEEGVQEVYEIVIDGYDIAMSGLYGTIYVYAYIYNEEGTYTYDSRSYSSAWYYEDDFDPVGAFFDGPHDDFGSDDDGDSLYDSLVFVVYVNASSSGYYDLEVDVYYYSYYDTLLFELYIHADTVMAVTFEIDSAWIYNNYVSSYWYLYMSLYDHYSMTEFDYETYSSDYYSYYEFDPPSVLFDPPHDDYAIDLDGDTYYDYLIVDVQLACTDEGYYTVTALLYDDWGGFVMELTRTVHMIPGSVETSFAFDGWIIELNGVSGYFTVYLEVEDEDGATLDDDVHYTDYYTYYSFAGPPAEFAPPHSSHAIDDAADDLYEYLAVEVVVDVYSAGDYKVLGVLFDYYSDFVDWDMNETYLEEGTQVVELRFDGWNIALAGAGLWEVELRLFDDRDNVMDTDYYDIFGVYDPSDFDPAVPSIDAVWAYDAPVIDGTVSEDEWFGAEAVDFLAVDRMNGMAATMYILNNDTHLFILMDVIGDTSASGGDVAFVEFDTGNDGVRSDGHEDEFMLLTTGAGVDTIHTVYSGGSWTEHCFPFDDTDTDHDGLAGAAGFGAGVESTVAHRLFELCIPLSLLMASPGDTLGLVGVVGEGYDADDEEIYSSWPMFFEDSPPMAMYGDVVLSEEPPLTTIDLDGDEGENGWFLGDVEVTLNATGGMGGVANTSYNLDDEGWQTYTAPFTVSGDGIHTVLYYSNDTAGNDEPVRTAEVMVDSEAPEATASVNGTMGLNGWLISSARITFVTIDNASGLAFIMYRLNGDDWSDLEGDALRLSGSGGTFVLDYYAVDVAGRRGFTKSLEFKFDMDDPVTNAAVEGSTVTLTVWDNASGSAGTKYRIDGGEWLAYDAPFKVRGGGNHTVEFYSIDVAGNNETIKTITVEGTSSLTVFGLDWWLVLLIGVIIILIAIGVVFGMRRGAKGPGGPEPMPPQAQTMMMEEPPPAWPGQPQTPPAGDEPPPPPERRD